MHASGPATTMVKLLSVAACLAGMALAIPAMARAGTDTMTSSKSAKTVDGLSYDANGDPTYEIASGGKVDWPTYSGFIRYNGSCNVCHGPDGSGSSFGPDLTSSLKAMDYTTFTTIVVNGRSNVSASQDSVMPAFGTNRNVMCYLDDIYVYLRARSDGAVGRGRPADHAPKPASAIDAENQCMGP